MNTEIIPEVLKAWQEYKKLWAEGRKLKAEADRLYAEADRLYAEGRKLYAEGATIILDAVLKDYGNLEIEWKFVNDLHELHLSNGIKLTEAD